MREMEINTIRRCYVTAITIANSTTLTNPNADEDVEQQALSVFAGGDAKCIAIL